MKTAIKPAAHAVTIGPATSVRTIAPMTLPTKETVMKASILKRQVLATSIVPGYLVRFLIPASIAAAFLVMAAPALAQHPGHVVLAQAPVAAKVAEAGAAQRDLWVGHIFWVRNVVVETFAGNKKAAAAAEKEVVANAKAIAASIEPFYGKAASEKLFGLLAGHYGAVKQHLEATAAGSKSKQDAAIKNLTGNATEIAKFLSGANPNLPEDAVLIVDESHQSVPQVRGMYAGDRASRKGATVGDTA